jgi:hypothetical protein
MGRGRVVMMILASLAGLAVAGCGGSGSSAASTTASGQRVGGVRPEGIFSAKLVAEADQICTALAAKLAAQDTAVPDRMTDPGLARLTALNQEAERAALARLSGFSLSGAGRLQWQRVIALRRAVVVDLGRLEKESAARNAAGREHAVLTLDEDRQRLIVATGHAGLHVCLVG